MAESTIQRRRSSVNPAADADLSKMGYQSDLPRHLSMLSILGMSFAIMAVPFGLSTTLDITLTDGQCVTIIWGWVLVSLISLSIASSLAEICAVFPTSGGPYYWSAMLSNKEWAPIASWICGWLNLVGNWTVTCLSTSLEVNSFSVLSVCGEKTSLQNHGRRY
ncbi:hypothetical protein MRB53_039347 [Persea americana]|nr:hypothetical protein MRB53_039347 [Persea americana]